MSLVKEDSRIRYDGVIEVDLGEKLKALGRKIPTECRAIWTENFNFECLIRNRISKKKHTWEASEEAEESFV